MANLGVKLGNIDFKNPVVMASGTFGFGKEYNEIYDIQKLGGVSSKGLTLEKRDGNKGTFQSLPVQPAVVPEFAGAAGNCPAPVHTVLYGHDLFL